MTWIKKLEALAEAQRQLPDLGMNEKILMNWTEEGAECPPTKVRGRIGFDADQFEKWLARCKTSIVALDKNDYIQCLEFAIVAYYNPITKADFSRVKQRDVGEFLTNQIQGKLGEVAFKKLIEKHGLAVELDFNAIGQIPSQDITRISTRAKVWDNPASKVSIKATKLKNVLLPVPVNEATLEDRKSDVYILAQVGLFPDHILRVLKQESADIVKASVKYIPDFAAFPARVAGWATHAIVTAAPAFSPDEAKKEFNIRFAAPNYVLRTGQLSVDWPRLKEIIVRGEKA